MDSILPLHQPRLSFCKSALSSAHSAQRLAPLADCDSPGGGRCVDSVGSHVFEELQAQCCADGRCRTLHYKRCEWETY